MELINIGRVVFWVVFRTSLAIVFMACVLLVLRFAPFPVVIAASKVVITNQAVSLRLMLCSLPALVV
eukprot:2975591-Amphidinium_carterae.1